MATKGWTADRPLRPEHHPQGSTVKVLDLFAGPGGWDVGAQALGLDPLGIEYDDAACATREAAGLRTVQKDVSLLNPSDFECDLLIASPPCQAWSMAGKRQGQEDTEKVYDATRLMAEGRFDLASQIPGWADKRSQLVTEPLRWALALRPTYLAWEQVPPVLDYWKLCADILTSEGYSVWTGILSAERYGVPQTRKRAILMASLDGPVEPPRPTHQAYTAGEPAWDEPMVSLEGELLPWVSMAEALGWGRPDLVQHTRSGGGEKPDWPVTEPSRTVCGDFLSWRVGFPRNADEGEATEDGYRERDFRDSDEPAHVVTEKTRSAVKMHKKEDRPERKAQGAGNQPRSEDQPAATIDTRTDLAQWKLRAGTQENDTSRAEDEPAPTIRYSERQNDVSWTQEKNWPNRRPATTVVADARLARPGHHGTPDEGDKYGGPQMRDAVRVTIEEASILQGFDPSYPWQGSRTKQFQQIGNAVPPPLAQAILEALTASARAEKEAA